MFSTGSLRHSWLYCLGNSQFLCSRNYSFVGASTFLCNCQLTGSVGEKEKGLGPAHLFLVVAQLHEICPDAPPVLWPWRWLACIVMVMLQELPPQGQLQGGNTQPEHRPQPIPTHLLLWASWVGQEEDVEVWSLTWPPCYPVLKVSFILPLGLTSSNHLAWSFCDCALLQHHTGQPPSISHAVEIQRADSFAGPALSEQQTI